VVTAPAAAISVVNPTVEKYGEHDFNLAPRLSTLAGHTIGLIWNAKANGDVALRTAAEQIGKIVPDATFKFYSGQEPCAPELLRQAVEECDAFIACTAD
jgi:hypothetical protein